MYSMQKQKTEKSLQCFHLLEQFAGLVITQLILFLRKAKNTSTETISSAICEQCKKDGFLIF